MKLTINEAHQLAERAMAALGHDAVDAAVIAHHLTDCEIIERDARGAQP